MKMSVNVEETRLPVNPFEEVMDDVSGKLQSLRNLLSGRNANRGRMNFCDPQLNLDQDRDDHFSEGPIWSSPASTPTADPPEESTEKQVFHFTSTQKVPTVKIITSRDGQVVIFEQPKEQPRSTSTMKTVSSTRSIKSTLSRFLSVITLLLLPALAVFMATQQSQHPTGIKFLDDTKTLVIHQQQVVLQKAKLAQDWAQEQRLTCSQYLLQHQGTLLKRVSGSAQAQYDILQDTLQHASAALQHQQRECFSWYKRSSFSTTPSDCVLVTAERLLQDVQDWTNSHVMELSDRLYGSAQTCLDWYYEGLVDSGCPLEAHYDRAYHHWVDSKSYVASRIDQYTKRLLQRGKVYTFEMTAFLVNHEYIAQGKEVLSTFLETTNLWIRQLVDVDLELYQKFATMEEFSTVSNVPEEISEISRDEEVVEEDTTDEIAEPQEVEAPEQPASEESLEEKVETVEHSEESGVREAVDNVEGEASQPDVQANVVESFDPSEEAEEMGEDISAVDMGNQGQDEETDDAPSSENVKEKVQSNHDTKKRKKSNPLSKFLNRFQKREEVDAFHAERETIQKLLQKSTSRVS